MLESKLFKISSKAIEVPKDSSGVISGKEYKYSSLPAMIKAVQPILEEEKVAYRFSVYSKDRDGVFLKFSLIDLEEGDVEDNEVFIPYIETQNQNIYQDTGAGLTFYKKYFLSTYFNLSAEDDTDANMKQIKKILLKEGTKDFEKAVEMIHAGATVKDLEGKYILKEDIASALQDVVDSFQSC